MLLFLATVTFSQQSYYSDVDLTLSGTALKDALAAKIIATHTRTLEYSSSGPDVWDATRATDENTSNDREVVLYYGWEDGSDQDSTNDLYRDKNLQDSGSGATFVWNREHVFPKSLANPKLDTDIPGPSTDAHHLRAADRGRNSARNNRKYGRGTGNSDYSSVDFHEGLDGPNTAAWYPGDDWKGDAARMIMYMYLRYGTVCLPTAVGVGSNEFTQDEMIDLFLQWNVEDPVSQIEIDRNTYHENTANTAAQGNRNPFIDNPYLATRIWGGNSAEDRWDYYISTDTEAPTTPTNVTLSNISLNSITVNWDASTDNKGVTGYNVYIDGVLKTQTTNTNTTFSNLETNTSYNFTVVAKDLINNMSATSTAVNGTTLQDTEAPTIPTNLVVSEETDSSFKVTWSASTDNNAISSYEIYVDNTLNGTSANNVYTITGLSTSTTYAVEIVAVDTDNNKSAKSATVNATTTAGTSNGITELFISEYVEPDGGNNKAIEIVNLTASTINLSEYSIQKQHNGSSWVDDFNLGNTNIVPGDVFVIINGGADDATLIAEADLVRANNTSTNNGSPMNFNGNDPIGLFKNGVLVDIIGQVGNSSSHIENKTYRRKASILSNNTTYTVNEWDVLAANTFTGIGSHDSTLSTEESSLISFKMYPNPTNGNKVFFETTKNLTIKVYNIVGKLILENKVSSSKNQLDITTLSKGIYFIKIDSDKNSEIKKLIKN
ncbi:endonuclease [Polaribacter ponticola]|uniref:Endonuclease n=1 Tax=Polaribacter ponticola TaxID=2978475 RepID=A0ABT5SEH2_9FLAO|nr:endonuclease [Polaribacter sp. MSW5]MDD7915945.1 endonuclease [Polaribacter sp. MSW5]